jgi:hypothetical protein
MKRTKSLKGGKLFGKGSFGTVYGEPRIPCDTETYEEVKDLNEVSKQFRNNYEADKEFSIVRKIHELIPNEEDLAIFKQNSMLPIKMCALNEEAIRQPPYSTPEWRQSSAVGHNSSNIVIYKKGKEDGSGYIQDLEIDVSVMNILQTFNGLFDILKAIHILHKHQLCHGDIKELNTINIITEDGSYKLNLSDNGDIRRILDINYNISYFSTHCMYFARPSISCYAEVWNRSKERTYLNQMNIDQPFTTNELITLIKQHQRFNEQSFTNVMYRLRHGLMFMERGFDKFKSYIYLAMSIDLFHQETFGMLKGEKYEYPIRHDLVYDIPFIRLLQDSNKPKMMYVENTLYKTNQMFQRLKNTPHQMDGRVKRIFYLKNYNHDGDIMGMDEMGKHLKIDLFNRFDIYSFGMMLFASLIYYRFGLIKFDITEKDEQRNRLIDQLIQFGYLCCKQTMKCIPTTILMEKYKRIIDTRGEDDIEIFETQEQIDNYHDLICDSCKFYTDTRDQIAILQEVATRGHIRALYMIGNIYKFSKDFERMNEYYTSAVARSIEKHGKVNCKYSAMSAYELGMYYITIQNVKPQAESMFKVSADFGIDKAHYQLGVYYSTEDDNPEYVELHYVYGAKHGDVECLKKLEEYYTTKHPDERKALLYKNSYALLTTPNRDSGYSTLHKLLEKDANYIEEINRLRMVTSSLDNPIQKEFLTKSIVSTIDYIQWKNTNLMNYFNREEETIVIRPDYIEKIQSVITPEIRERTINWLYERNISILEKQPIREEKDRHGFTNMALAVSIIDRYLSLVNIPREKFEYIAICALYMATRYMYTIKSSVHPLFVKELESLPKLDEFSGIPDGQIILKLESEIHTVLNLDVVKPTATQILHRLLDVCKFENDRMIFFAEYAVELTYQEYRMLQYRPSLIASAVMYVALQRFGYRPWTQFLMFYTGYIDFELFDCIQMINEVVNRDKSTPRAVDSVYEKQVYEHHMINLGVIG